MTTTWCPDLSGDPAITLVGAAHDKFINLGTTTYNLAVANLDALNAIEFNPVEFNVDFAFADPQATFSRPLRPVFDSGALDFRDPGVSIPQAPAFVSNPLSFTEAPAIIAEVPTLSFGAKPVTPVIAEPVMPADAGPLVMPDEPTYVLPVAPSLEQLRLPELPVIRLPEYTGSIPDFIEPPFNETWSFEPEPYTQTLVSTLVDTLRPMIVGSEALPRIIEDAIFERSRSRIEVETNRAVDQVFAEFGSRGFSEPPGMLAGRVMAARQAGQSAMAEASRDVAIKQFEESLASQRFAITQGAALEGALIQLHLAEQANLLQAATFQRESAIAVLNIRVQIFNARLQAAQTEAQVLRDRIQAELAKVELFRAQIEGERARGEINDQKVRLYLGQISAVNALADFYRNRVEVVKVQADVNKLAVDKYRAAIDAFEARWSAHTAEWQGYSAGVEGEGKRVDIFRTMVQASADRVDAWSKSQNMTIDAERLRLQQHGMNLDVWKAGISRWEALLGSERARLSAVGQAVDAQARIYTADASVEQIASAAADRSFELGLAREKASIDAQLSTANAKIQQMLGLLQQHSDIQKAKAQIASQLAASTMSAVSYGASISSGRSKSSSCSQNFSFQGEVADA